MLQVSIEAIKDYQTCSLLYDFRHQNYERGVISSTALEQDRYENNLHKVINFFFFKKQGGQAPSYSALLNRWEKLWFPKDLDAYDLAIQQNAMNKPTLVSLNSQAAIALGDFYEHFKDDSGQVFLLDEEFFVQLSPTMRLLGRIDLVLRDEKSYRIYKFSKSSKRLNIDQFGLDSAAMHMAMVSKSMKLDRKLKYLVYQMGPISTGLYPLKVSNHEIGSLRYWANQLENDNVFAPRRGLTTACKTCVFDRPCREWSFGENIV